MIGTGMRQLRMGLALMLGRSLNPTNMQALARNALRTIQELGSLGDDAQALLGGSFPTLQARRDFETFSLQRTARTLARRSPYYRQLFDSLPVAPGTLNLERLSQVPLTTYQTLLTTPSQDFIADGTTPFLATPIGSHGRAIDCWLSHDELLLWSALAALRSLLQHQTVPHGCLHLYLPQEMTANIHLQIAQCQLLGIHVHVSDLLPPDRCLDQLLDGGGLCSPLLLHTIPSYLAQLVTAARRRGLARPDFRITSLSCQGAFLSRPLLQAIYETFGIPVLETYMPLLLGPANATVCREGHLHPDPTTALFEVRSMQSGLPAMPGELGTLVVTPYYPYHTCMPLLRYDTRAVVRCLPQEPYTCELADVPATSLILGTAEQLLTVGSHVVTTRELMDASEALPSHPWPISLRAQVTSHGLALELPIHAMEGLSTRGVLHHFQAAGLPVSTISYVPGNDFSSLHSVSVSHTTTQLYDSTRQESKV